MRVNLLMVSGIIKIWIQLLLAFLLLITAGQTVAANSGVGDEDTSHATIYATRDTSLSTVHNEQNSSNGGSSKIKLKGQQEMVLLDFDLTALRGRLISKAVLRLKSASPAKATLARLGVSSLAAPWFEGNGTNYRFQAGSSSFALARHDTDWAYPGSTLMDVVFGRGNTIWAFAECSPPDSQDWQNCPVSPEVVTARIAGLSEGLCLYDEVGSEWAVHDDKFSIQWFPNRYIYSRENLWGKNEPRLEVWTKGTDIIPPPAVQDIKIAEKKLPPGEALISWSTPQDQGGGRTAGFNVSYEWQGQQLSVPRYLVPLADRPGERVFMHLRDLDFRPDDTTTLHITTVDSAGNSSKAVSVRLQLPSRTAFPKLTAPLPVPFQPQEKLLQLGKLKIGVIDLLDKISPQNDTIIPPHPSSYLGGNHLFSATQGLVRLQAAKNETISFQLLCMGGPQKISVRYVFDEQTAMQPRLWQFAYVKSGKEDLAAPLPDPLLPVTASGDLYIPSKAGHIQVEGQINTSLICELYVPSQTVPGLHHGKLIISSGGEEIIIKVNLQVWDFTLPNKLSFVPEMNAYGTVSPDSGYQYYQMAHEHRTCINRLSYGWGGQPSFAPLWHDNNFSWQAWDKAVGPLLDGSAFADFPRANEPLDVFYLPINENWPIPIAEHYTPSYWAEEALDSDYQQQLQRAMRLFVDHLEESGWHNTKFQFYLNNKIAYRLKYRQSSAPWFFDEPVNTQDFWALRWFGQLWRGAKSGALHPENFQFRADVSYSQFSRDLLMGVVDNEYLGGNTFQKTRMMHDEQARFREQQFAEYGNANQISEANTQPVLWCISAWLKGATGVMPWQSIGSKHAWDNAEQTALFYPSATGPNPSVRLKAFTRGQQDVEYLALFSQLAGIPRFEVANWLNNFVDLKEEFQQKNMDDAGTAKFKSASPADLWKIRYILGSWISEQHPPYQHSLLAQSGAEISAKLKKQADYFAVPTPPRSRRPDGSLFNLVPEKSQQ